jgi:hypothetical protein
MAFATAPLIALRSALLIIFVASDNNRHNMLMSQVDEPLGHERGGLAVLKRRVPLLDDHRSTASGRS